MKILFISGSPRKAGNTAEILRILTERIKDITDTEILYLTDYKVNGCLGCAWNCQKNLDEPGCIQQDDTEDLLQKLIAADAIFYSTPLYGHSYSGQLKLFMDRHVALFKFVGGGDKSVEEMEIHSLIANKPVGLIISCQGPEQDNTELIQAQFDKFCQSSLTKCIGKYIFPWCDTMTERAPYSEATLQKIIEDINPLFMQG